jgi:hypothetical protein
MDVPLQYCLLKSQFSLENNHCAVSAQDFINVSTKGPDSIGPTLLYSVENVCQSDNFNVPVLSITET